MLIFFGDFICTLRVQFILENKLPFVRFGARKIKISKTFRRRAETEVQGFYFSEFCFIFCIFSFIIIIIILLLFFYYYFFTHHCHIIVIIILTLIKYIISFFVNSLLPERNLKHHRVPFLLVIFFKIFDPFNRQ